MILDTSIFLEAALEESASSAQPVFHVYFRDYNREGVATPPALSRGSFSHSAVIVMLTAPGDNNPQREIVGAIVYNPDVITHNFRFRTDVGASGTGEFLVNRVTLSAGERVQYTSLNGWFKTSN